MGNDILINLYIESRRYQQLLSNYKDRWITMIFVKNCSSCALLTFHEFQRESTIADEVASQEHSRSVASSYPSSCPLCLFSEAWRPSKLSVAWVAPAADYLIWWHLKVISSLVSCSLLDYRNLADCCYYRPLQMIRFHHFHQNYPPWTCEWQPSWQTCWFRLPSAAWCFRRLLCPSYLDSSLLHLYGLGWSRDFNLRHLSCLLKQALIC